MSITQDGYTFTGVHGPMMIGDPEERMQVSSFPAVRGSKTISGPPGAREIWLDYTIKGHSTDDSLEAAIRSINNKQGELLGTVTVSSPFAGVYRKCTFRGFRVQSKFMDGKVPLAPFVARGRLVWLQRDPTALS